MTEPEQTDQSSADESRGGIDPALLKKAMKAFRKKLKLSRLDEESKLGRSPLTGGKKSTIVAITPPYGYPQEVWKELARQGRLKDTGRGFYQLVE